MRYFENESYSYRNDVLFVEDVAVGEISEKTGTPVFIYSKKHISDRFRQFADAFRDIDHHVFYASKANFNINVINIFRSLGSGIDVNSEGEMIRALKAGVAPQNIILSGIGKTADEIRAGLDSDVLMLKAESEEEIELIAKIAESKNKKARVAIRVNPEVDAKTHPYISTGLAQNKFGINEKDAESFYLKYNNSRFIKFTGIDMHIGSQITSLPPFIEAVEKLSAQYFRLKSQGITLEHFDVGGGMGVVYKEENPFSIHEFAEALKPHLRKLGCKILFEPGRYFMANSGILVSDILYTKKNDKKNFLITDAAMTELMRPSLYGSYHNVQPLIRNKYPEIKADIVGPVCESGDFIAKDREIEDLKQNDKIAIISAGAYGMVMASNYNGRRRPPEVIVDGDKYFITRSRETFDHLLYDEKLIKELI